MFLSVVQSYGIKKRKLNKYFGLNDDHHRPADELGGGREGVGSSREQPGGAEAEETEQASSHQILRHLQDIETPSRY